jgi:hypothetical protein
MYDEANDLGSDPILRGQTPCRGWWGQTPKLKPE